MTGVSGFVGGHLAEHLIAEGDLVVGLSASGRWPDRLAHLGRDVRIERCDLSDVAEADLADLIARKQPEVIYHLAAQANPQASVADPRGTWALNLGGAVEPAGGGEGVGIETASDLGGNGSFLRQSGSRTLAGE